MMVSMLRKIICIISLIVLGALAIGILRQGQFNIKRQMLDFEENPKWVQSWINLVEK
jgi:hypothetical protein